MKTMKIAMSATIVALTALSVSAAPIYTYDFGGDSGTQLNGTATTTGGGTWVANSIATQTGVTGAGEGSALLAFSPVVNQQYELSLDVNHGGTSAWVGLGFARDALGSVGSSSTSERFTNNPEGISWFLYRKESTTANDIQIFEGLRATSQIIDTDADLYEQGVSKTLSIVIDTTGDGSSFTADYFIDGVSMLSSGPATIIRNIDDLNYAGFTVDGSGTSHTVDNFSLAAIPEPATLGLVAVFGGGVLFIRRRFMI